MIKKIKTYSLAICLLILILTTSSCVGGNSKIGTAEDPYIQAQASKLMSPLGSSNGITNNDVPNLDVYSFHREYCYGGDVINDNNTAYCVFKDTTGNQIRINNNQITTKPKSGKDAVYAIHAMQITKVGAQVFVLSADKKLIICSLGGDCKNAEGAYSDMLAIDCTEQISGITVTCKTDKANYRSILLLTDPTISKAQTPSAYKLSSQLLQLFINNASDVGVNVWNSDSDKGYIVKRADIKSDVPLAEIVESDVSRADLINYSFGTVEDKFFNLQLIYGRHQNKGTAYQSYYAGFQYGANLIKPDVSTNTLPIRTRDHITVFTPVAQEPLFEGGEVYKKMLEDLRRVAGGSHDSGDNYEWCAGLNVYCLIGARYGYANISDNYTSDVIDNAVFFGFMHVSDSALGKLSELSKKIPGKNLVAEFGRGFGKYVVPLIGKSATMLVLQRYGMQLHDIFLELTTENPDKNLPTLTPAVNEILNLPQKGTQVCADGGPGHLYCHTEWSTSDCEKELITQLTNREVTLKKNPDNIIFSNSKTVDDLFMATKECSDKVNSISLETRSLMKSIQIDKLNNFKSSTVSLVYQKLFIESDNNNKKTIDLQPDDLSDFIAESDPEQPAADISLRIPNCTGGACDATYFADSQGNWLKGKNGKFVSAINGTFINVYYMRTDSNFRPPLLWRIQDGVLPANLTYSITAYQLSDLTCDEFNTKMTKITGNANVAARAALRDRDAWSVILDKKGNTCNLPVNDYGMMVHKYDNSLVGDIFMALPLSTDPATLLIMYSTNFLIGTIDEINRINNINPYDYPIRNAHTNSQDPTEFNCTDLNITLNGNENLQQISASHLPEGGMWIIGDNGLRYIDNNDNQKYTFTYNQSGSGVANSYNGKLLISTSKHSMITIDRYDEEKIFEYTNRVLHLAPNTPDFSINISDVKDPLLKEGSYPGTTDFGGNARYVKLYTNQQNQLFGNYTRSKKGDSRPSDTTNLYSWDINTWEKQGWITHNDEKEIDNFIITANGSLNWISKYANAVGWNSTSSIGEKPNEVIFTIDPEHPHIWDNPLVFSILNHVFVLTDTGEIFSISDYKEFTKKVAVSDMGKTSEISMLQNIPTQIGKSGISLNEPITDIVGLEDGRFYLLSNKKVYRCQMPANYIGVVNKPLVLNIINKTDNLRYVSLSAMNIANKYTITPGYISSNGEQEIDFKPQENQTIKIQKNNIKDEDFIFNDELYFVGQYQLDSLSIYATGAQNGDFKVEMKSRFASKIFKITTEKVSDNEYNIIVEKNGDDVPPPRDYHYSTQGEIAEIQTDNNNKKVLQSVRENFDCKKYTNTRYDDNSKKIIIDGKLYWLGVSEWNSSVNKLLIVYYDIGSNTNPRILQDIEFIKLVDGSTLDVKTFCENQN